LAKSYWQHTGDGISSRFAEKCLSLLKSSPTSSSTSTSNKNLIFTESNQTHQVDVRSSSAGSSPRSTSPIGSSGSVSPTNSNFFSSSSAALDGISSVEGGVGALTSNQKTRSYGRNKYYSRGATTNSTSISGTATPTSISPPTPSNTGLENLSISSKASSSTLKLNGSKEPSEAVEPEILNSDATTYLEERYGRNLPLTSASLAKKALRRRIAGKLEDSAPGSNPTQDLLEDGVNEDIGVAGSIAETDQARVNESDVWLMPTGMSAIFHAHQVAMEWRRRETGNRGEELGKSVCFG